MGNTKALNETKLLSLADLHNNQKSEGLYFTLTVIEGLNFGFVYIVENSETIIGRKSTNDESKIDIEVDDERASRRHLILLKREDPAEKGVFRVFALDLGSTNGAYINGQRLLDKEVRLDNNDKLQIGSTVLKFEIKDTLESNYQERIFNQVTRDPMTGLWNHNYVRQEMERLISLGRRHNWPFSIILFKVDYLQILNETFGRVVGDNLLKAIAQIINEEISGFEIAARYDGNGFLIVLPETEMKGAKAKSEKLRQSVENADFSAIGCSQRVTISGGIAQYPLCGDRANDLIKQADEALYRAVQIGRNRIAEAEISIPKSTNIKKFLAPLLMGIVVILSLYLAASYIYPLINKAKEKNWAFSGTVEINQIQVASKVGGRVTKVLVQEGQVVKAGAIIATFDIAELETERKLLEANLARDIANLRKLENGARQEEVAEAEAMVRSEEAYLEELHNGPRPQEVGMAKTDLDSAKADLENAEINFKRLEQLYQEGYTAKQNRDDAEMRKKMALSRYEGLRNRMSMMEDGTRREQIKAAQERIQASKSKVALLRAGTRPEEIMAARASVKAAQIEIEKINIKIGEGTVVAPVDCRIDTIAVRPGDVISPNSPIAKLLEQSQIWVRIYVPHTDLGMVKVNQKASINIDAFPDVKFPAYIESISDEAEFYPRNVQTRSDREYQVFGVKVHVDASDGKLKSGMNATVTLDVTGK